MTSTLRRPALARLDGAHHAGGAAPMITTSCICATEAPFCFRNLLSGEQGESQSRASS